ncbi:MAG: MFS transporter [Chloroflexi bacterium]|nr:MFS transporter [Chloroflexota bacterium]
MALFGRGGSGPATPADADASRPPDDMPMETTSRDFEPPTRTFHTGLFASFHYSDFRLLWIGQLGWSGANWMEQVARNWLVWELTGSGVALGLVNLFRALPQLFMSLPAGVAADRFNKKYVLMACQSMTMTSYVCLLALVLTDLIQLWHIYLFSFLLGISMAFNQPARNALIPSLVPEHIMLNGFALNQVAMNFMRVIAPGIAGLLIGWFDVMAAFVGAVALFAVVIVATIIMKAPGARSVSQTESASGQLREGVSYVLADKNILVVMVVALAVFTFVMPYNTLMPILADNVLDIGAQGFGMLLSVAGIGALIGGLTVAAFGDVRHKGLLFLGSSFGYAFSVFLLGVSPSLGLGILLPMFVMLFIGAGQAIFMTAGNVALMAHAPEELRGRILSVYNLDRGLMPLGSAGGGALADFLSAPIALMLMGGAASAMIAVVGALSSRIRRL